MQTFRGTKRVRLYTLLNTHHTFFALYLRTTYYKVVSRYLLWYTKILIDMEAKPQARTLEITVMSGENICVDRSSGAENVYVVVRAESLNSCTTKTVNEDKGVHAWNEKLLLDIPTHARSVTFEVQCKKYKGVRPIGVARIALSDFLSNDTKIVSESVPQMYCYGLRNWEGRQNGVIHFSVKVVSLAGDKYLCSETKQEKDIIGIEHSSLVELPKCSCLKFFFPIFRWR
ncbi:hypothetical protein JHK85_006225 [Glycine max]|uniref:C2 domain-containing protein n=2 Tax=Glycine subgen. Soja TaxID=1462606 RepID=K7KC78_SOYBN|nr:hypothetical protein JHK85_006225 [Glycine max]